MILPRVEDIPGDSKVPQILGGIIFPQILAIFFLIGRAISRIHVLGHWSWDDSLIVFAWINTLALSILLGIATNYGQGHHIEDVPLSLLVVSFSITYITLINYQFALCFTKLSILVFYLRVFPARREKWMTWGTIIFVVLFSIPLIIGDLLLCKPIVGESFLGKNVVCFTPAPLLVASAVFHTITDIWLILMVIPVVMSLQIPRRQKRALMAVLSLGVFVIVASIARIISIMDLDGQEDITWTMAVFDIWTILECCIGLICACAPTIRPLLCRVFPNLMASHSGTGSRYAVGRRSGAIELGSRNLRVTTVTGGQKQAVEREPQWTSLSDNVSEENMLKKQPGVIMKSTAFTVTNTPM